MKRSFSGNRGSKPRRRVASAAFTTAPAFAPRVEGVLSITRGGSGFVSRTDGSADVFIPEEAVGAALPGDIVEVRLESPASGDSEKPRGRIVRVVKRGERDIVCTLRKTGRHWTGFPLTPLGGRTFNVSDPKNAKDGDRAVLRFSSWDNPTLNPDAQVVGVIGPSENPSLDTISVEKAYDLPEEFPQEVLEEASRVGTLSGALEGREDLRGQTVVTIDPPSAKDFDDALSFGLDEKGRRVLGVHIADVSHFVRPASAIDREALKRGTSVYLVDHVLPMLPEQLSNGICSLVEGEDRLTFSVFITFDARGTIAARRFAKTIIRSSRRMTYGEALEVIEADGHAPAQVPEEVRALVMSCHALSQQLRRNRFDRFSLDLSSPEMEIDLSPEGLMTGIHPAEHNVAHELVEEAMIAANEAVAMELAAAKIHHLSRFHDVPDEEKMDDLQSSLASLGIRTGAIRDAGAIKRLLKAVSGTALEWYVSSLVLRSLKRAEYSADKAGHFGLAKRFYCHFTSPIRRYPDLVAHRQLALALSGNRKAQPLLGELREIAARANQTELRADQAERDLVEIKKYRYLAQRLAAGDPPEYEAAVVKTVAFGLFVEVPDLMLGGLVHVSGLSSHFVRRDRSSGRMEAPGLSVGPGDRIRVLVSSVDFENRKIDFAFKGLVKEERKPERRQPRSKHS